MMETPGSDTGRFCLCGDIIVSVMPLRQVSILLLVILYAYAGDCSGRL